VTPNNALVHFCDSGSSTQEENLRSQEFFSVAQSDEQRDGCSDRRSDVHIKNRREMQNPSSFTDQ
jgi:hypothetical protein